jgi:predicted aconitase with swiveling domain
MTDPCGALLILERPLGIWGGLDPETGTIIDRHHPQVGSSIVGRVVVMPGTQGSSSGAGVLVEAIRRGNGPAALVLPRPDFQIMVANMLSNELYGRGFRIEIVSPQAYEVLCRRGDSLRKAD